MTLRRRILAALARRPALGTATLLAPGGLWLVLFFVVPMLLMLGASVMQRGTYGGVEPGFTLEHYRRFLDPLYLQVLWRTIVWAALATVACLLLGFPVAWVIAASRRHRSLLLFLVVLPFWTSFLVRTFAMIFLMRDTGLINTWLLKLGVMDDFRYVRHTELAAMVETPEGRASPDVAPALALDGSLEHRLQSLQGKSRLVLC